MSENSKGKWENVEDKNTEKKKYNEEKEGVNDDISKNSVDSIQEIITGQLNNNLVVFAGPRESGKTVALMRLTHYLRQNRNIKIEPNRNYRQDASYQTSVNSFLNDLHNPHFSPKRTGSIDFLVLDVFKESELYCQFLEAPGEAFFDPDDPHSIDFPTYITDILSKDKLNKVFVFFFENQMLLQEDPMAYSSRLSRLVSMMNKKNDDIIILYNKADRLRELYTGNRPNEKEFKRLLFNDEHYSDFFGSLKTLGIRMKFVPFSSGTFQQVPGKNLERWIHSQNSYPDELWRNIDKCFKSVSWLG